MLLARYGAISGEKPSCVNSRGMSALYAAAVGYFFLTCSSSCASVYWPRGRKPLYQMSNGSSGRPRRFSIKAATRGTSGEASTASSIPLTRASGISRFSLKRRSISVGAVGEYGSTSLDARNVLRIVA